MSRDSGPPTCTSGRPPSTRSSHSGSSDQSDSSTSSSYSTISDNIRIPVMNPTIRRGFDMRRPAPLSQPPASTSQPQDIIDLTEEPSSPPERFLLPLERRPDPLSRRPPRHPPQQPVNLLQHNAGQSVIDLSDEEGAPYRPLSPDIQFLSARARSQSLNRNERRHGWGAQDDSAAQNQRLPWLAEALPRLRNVGNQLARVRDQLVAWEQFPMPEASNMPMPEMLDFGAVGFDLNHPEQQPQHRPPTYEAPSAAQPGFTRSNTDPNILLICPSCEAELGEGEGEQKRQVWVVKACGHVYCGECIQSRRLLRKKPASKKPAHVKQVSQCIVDKCGKSATKRGLIQIYL